MQIKSLFSVVSYFLFQLFLLDPDPFHLIGIDPGTEAAPLLIRIRIRNTAAGIYAPLAPCWRTWRACPPWGRRCRTSPMSIRTGTAPCPRSGCPGPPCLTTPGNQDNE